MSVFEQTQNIDIYEASNDELAAQLGERFSESTNPSVQ